MANVWWRIMFTLDVVLLVLLVMSIPYIEPGSPTYVIAVTSGGVILLTLLGLSVLIWTGWDPFEVDYHNN